MDEWKNKILEKIKPTREQREEINGIVGEVLTVLRNHGYKAMLTGSIAKDTFLASNSDIDIFVLFDPSLPYEEMETRIKSVMDQCFPNFQLEKRYTHHPYYTMRYGRYYVDVVPAYAISESDKPISPVDRTVFHTKYVQNHLDEQMRDEARLLKAFFKANYLYGAEIRVEGFSGYLCELLITMFKTFERTLNFFADLTGPVELDIENCTVKQAQQFFVHDPVDPKRNVAAALSKQNLWRTSFISQFFDRCRAEAWFCEKMESIPEEMPQVIVAELKSERPSDIMWGKVKRIMRVFSQDGRKEEYHVLPPLCLEDKFRYFLVFGMPATLSNWIVRQGPLMCMKKNVQKFGEKYGLVYFEDDRIKAWVKRGEEPLSKLNRMLEDAGIKVGSVDEETKKECVKRYCAYLMPHKKT